MTLNAPPFSANVYALDRKQTLSGIKVGRPIDNLKLVQAFQAKYPLDGYSNHILAKAFIEAGRNQEALRFAQAAVQFTDLAPDSVSQLAQLYLELAIYEPLALLLSKAIAKSPGSAILASDFGEYNSRIGDTENALKQYQRALELTVSTRHADAIKRALVETLHGANRHAEAQHFLDELGSKPEHRAFALSRRSQVGKQQSNSSLKTDIEAALSSKQSAMSLSDRVMLLLSLGRLYENDGNYDAAFSHWRQAREIDKAPYDSNLIDQSWQQMKTLYTKELFDAARPFANPTDAPVFVVGMPRSGTTLTEQILASHPSVSSVGELGILGRRALHFLLNYGNPGGRNQLLANAMKGELLARAKEFLNVCKIFTGRTSERIVDKTPTQFVAAGFIHLCLPNARFIHINRHPADTFISTYQNNFTKDFGIAFDQRAFVHFFLRKEQLMAHWRTIFGNRILDVHYEDLVANPEETVRTMLAFLDLEWDPACLKFFDRQTSVRTFCNDQVRSAINTNSVARWKNYESHLAPLFKELAAGKYQYRSSN